MFNGDGSAVRKSFVAKPTRASKQIKSPGLNSIKPAQKRGDLKRILSVNEARIAHRPCDAGATVQRSQTLPYPPHRSRSRRVRGFGAFVLGSGSLEKRHSHSETPSAKAAGLPPPHIWRPWRRKRRPPPSFDPFWRCLGRAGLATSKAAQGCYRRSARCFFPSYRRGDSASVTHG
jgi:hypothetical protein